jgi:hypothetical protein
MISPYGLYQSSFDVEDSRYKSLIFSRRPAETRKVAVHAT